MPRSPSRQYRRRHYDRDPEYDDEYYNSEDEVERKPRSRSREIISRIGHHITGRSQSSRRRTRSVDSRDYSRSRDRRHRDYDSPKRSNTSSRKLEHAIDAAIEAAAVEAVRVRREPGKWAGSKGTRVATAAAGAALVDSMFYDRKSKHGKRQTVGSIAGGLLANRIFNGPRKELRHR